MYVQCKCECNANCIISSFQLQLNSSEWYTFCHCFTRTPHSTCAQKTDRQTYTFWPSCFSKARIVFIFRAHLHCSSFVLISFFFPLFRFICVLLFFFCCCCFFFCPVTASYGWMILLSSNSQYCIHNLSLNHPFYRISPLLLLLLL